MRDDGRIHLIKNNPIHESCCCGWSLVIGWMQWHENGDRNNNKIDDSNKSIIFCGDTIYGGGRRTFYGECDLWVPFALCIVVDFCGIEMRPTNQCKGKTHSVSRWPSADMTWYHLIWPHKYAMRGAFYSTCAAAVAAIAAVIVVVPSQSQLKCMTSSSIRINKDRYVIPSIQPHWFHSLSNCFLSILRAAAAMMVFLLMSLRQPFISFSVGQSMLVTINHVIECAHAHNQRIHSQRIQKWNWKCYARIIRSNRVRTISIVYSSIHSSFPFDPFHSYSNRIDLIADVWCPTATPKSSSWNSGGKSARNELE